MLGLFGTAPYRDEVLGDLKRSGRYWKGSFSLDPHGTVKVMVAGGRSGPDSGCLALARDLPEKYTALRPDVQTSLFQHYEPCREAAGEGVLPQHPEAFPEIANSDSVWPYVTVAFVRIEPLLTGQQMVDTVEVAYEVAWDEEHTLGARIQNWRLLELCGSV